MDTSNLRDFLKNIYYHLPLVVAGLGFVSVLLLTSVWILLGKPESEPNADSFDSRDQTAIQVQGTFQDQYRQKDNDAAEASLGQMLEKSTTNSFDLSIENQPLSDSPNQLAPTLEIVGLHDWVNPQRVYVVQAGDNLWQIAAAQLGDGARYPEIATANNILNPDILPFGMTIIIEPTKFQKPVRDQILTGVTTENTYQVKAGDSLWSIATTELGDPYRWVEIFELNRAYIGQDPDRIEFSQILMMP